MAQYNDHAPFSALSGSWASSSSRNPTFFYHSIHLWSCSDWKKTSPIPCKNAIGGEVYGLYIPQQLPFAGVTNMELDGQFYHDCIRETQTTDGEAFIISL